jgi:hypothetical protein
MNVPAKLNIAPHKEPPVKSISFHWPTYWTGRERLKALWLADIWFGPVPFMKTVAAVNVATILTVVLR